MNQGCKLKSNKPRRIKKLIQWGNEINMIYKNEENNSIIVTCYCGCENSIRVEYDKECKNVSFGVLNSDFYTGQRTALKTIKMRLKQVWYIIRGKDYYYADILMKSKEFEVFKEYINSIDINDGV